MRNDSSIKPSFESGDDRIWFLVRLPTHERATPEPTDQDASLQHKDSIVLTGKITVHVTDRVKKLAKQLKGEEP